MPARRLLLLLLVATLVACGPASPEELLDRAPEALEEAGTSRFEMRVSAVGEGVDSSFSAQGEQDLEAGTLWMQTDLGLDATATETLVTDDMMYLRSPLFELFTGDAEGWVGIDLDQAGRTAGLELDQLVEGHTGPAALVQQLRGAAGDIEELGTEEVRGVETRHLRVRVDTDRAIEQSPEETRDQLRAFAESSGLPSEYPMEVWIDDDARVRRVSTVVEVEDEVAGPVTQQTVLELFDFGIAVDIEAPAPERVVDLRALLQDLDELEAGLEGDGAAADLKGDRAAPDTEGPAQGRDGEDGGDA